MEPAPVGVRLPPGPVAVLYDGLATDPLSALDAELTYLPRGASEEDCRGVLAAIPEARTLVDLRFVAWDLDSVTAAEAGREAALAVLRLARALFTTPSAIDRVVVGTSLDGAAGFGDGERASPAAAVAYGAAGGAWKSVVREWPEAQEGKDVSLCLVDLADGLNGAGVEGIREALSRRAPLELAAGRLTTPVLRPVESVGEPVLTSRSVILLTGGARGVTARIARELATRFACKLVLADRCGVAQNDTQLDPGSARKLAREELGTGANPQALNAVVERLLGEQQAAETVAGLEALGSEVLYCQGDITDPEVASRILREAQTRFGSIDVVIHGAGIDRSRNLLAKEEAEVATVLSVKTAAAELFAASGARCVGFCSVAGRLGNAGQIDYCSANEALAKLVLAHGGLALDFTAWADIGMAAPIAKAMRERGVDPLEPEDAARVAVDLIAGGACGEYVLAGRLRPHDASVSNEHVLEGEVLLEVPGAELRRTAELELEGTAYLRDHRPTSAGVLPAVVALQGMIDAAATLEPDLPVRGVRDLKIEQAVKVFPDQRVMVGVEADRKATEAGTVAFGARVTTEAGVHHRATVMLGGEPGEVGRVEVENGQTGPIASEVYRTFFHGDSFRVLEGTEIGDHGLKARSVPLGGELGRDLPERSRHQAMARELALQAAGVFLMTAEHRLALPIGVAELVTAALPREGEQVEARVRYRREDSDEEVFLFDASLHGEDGRELERLSGLSFRYLGKI